MKSVDPPQMANWGHVGLPFSGNVSGKVTSPFPNPTNPDKPPFGTVPFPDHVQSDVWQTSYYDPRSNADMSVYSKRPSGPVSLETGKLTGDGFHAEGGGTHWHQV